MLHRPFWQYHILIYKISKRKTQQYAHATEQSGTVRLENGTCPRLRTTKRLHSGTDTNILPTSFSRVQTVENVPTAGHGKINDRSQFLSVDTEILLAGIA